MMSPKVEFFLYSKPDCAACDVFKASLDENNIPYYLIDITGDPDLKYRYGARIPVLVAGTTEVCEGAYDGRAVEHYLGNAGQNIKMGY